MQASKFMAVHEACAARPRRPADPACGGRRIHARYRRVSIRCAVHSLCVGCSADAGALSGVQEHQSFSHMAETGTLQALIGRNLANVC
jgi:hypothetical protein